MTGRYLEEFAPGQKFASGQLKVDRERIKSFAAEFDPQPFTSTKRPPNEPVQVSVGNLIVRRRLASTG